MLRLIYTVLFYLIQPFVIIKLLLRSRKSPGYRHRIAERYGFCRGKVQPHGFLIHSVSVGETIAALPLIQQLQIRYPDQPITVTTMTVTGSDLVKKTLGDRVSHVYLPYDLPCAIRRFLNTLQPRQVIIMETELWPNLIHALHRRQIPLLIANARLSERSARRYARLGSSMTRLLREIPMIAVQNQIDAERFRSLGQPDTQLCVTGSIKFDIQLSPAQCAQIDHLKQQWPTQRRTWIAASTHTGEDKIILNVHQHLLSLAPDLLLILVPRHPERFASVQQLIEKQGFSYLKRSEHSVPKATTQVILGDTMGELTTLYAMADFAFVGGSLVEHGGHNPLEPALHQLPLVMGPHFFNFSFICQQLIDAQGVIIVDREEALCTVLKQWLADPKAAQAIGKQAHAVLMQNQGALDKLLQWIDQQWTTDKGSNDVSHL